VVHRDASAGAVPSRPRHRAAQLPRPNPRHHHRAMADPAELESRSSAKSPSPPFRAEREGPNRDSDWEGEVGLGERAGIPHLTPTLSAPGGGEGLKSFPALPAPLPLARFAAADDLRAAIGLWTGWLGGERRASAHTVAAYGRDLAFFLDFLAEHLGETPAL